MVATTEKPADLTPTAAAAPSAADLLSDAPPVLDLQTGKALGGSAAPAAPPRPERGPRPKAPRWSARATARPATASR
ncbi:hypothetical protein ACFQ1I_37735 [Kitasatospora arboriphila]